MLLLLSSLHGLIIQASDGEIGTVRDFLLDDSTWHLRWMVVRTGTWLAGARTALIHLSEIDHVDHQRGTLAVRLTKQEVQASPDILLDEPVSGQIEYGMRDYPCWDPAWGNPRYVSGLWGGIGVRVSRARLDEEKSTHGLQRELGQAVRGDPHLRSFAAITGNHVHAADGLLGHLQDLYVDRIDWRVRYLVIDTRNWLPGRRVLAFPDAVRDISWPDQEIRLAIPLDLLRSSPAWYPDDVIDEAYLRRLHDHYRRSR